MADSLKECLSGEGLSNLKKWMDLQSDAMTNIRDRKFALVNDINRSRVDIVDKFKELTHVLDIKAEEVTKIEQAKKKAERSEFEHKLKKDIGKDIKELKETSDKLEKTVKSNKENAFKQT